MDLGVLDVCVMFGTMNTSGMKINVDSSNLLQLHMPWTQLSISGVVISSVCHNWTRVQTFLLLDYCVSLETIGNLIILTMPSNFVNPICYFGPY